MYAVSEKKKRKVWACQQDIKKYKCLQKKKEKCIDTTKIRVDIVLEKGKKSSWKRIEVRKTLGFSRK